MTKTHDISDSRIIPFILRHFFDGTRRTRIIAIIGFVVSWIPQACSLIIPLVIAKFVDALIRDPQSGDIWLSGWWMVFVIMIVQVLAYRVRIWCFWYRIMPEFQARMRTTLFNRLMRHGPDFFANQFSGALVNKIRLVADAGESLFDEVAIKMLEGLLLLMVACIVLMRINAAYTWVIIGCMIPMIIIGCFMGRVCAARSEQRSAKVSALTGFLVDTITNLSAVRHFVGWSKERALMTSFQGDVIRAARRVNIAYAIMWLTFGIFTALMQAGMLWIVAHDFRSGAVSAGEILMIVTYAGMLTMRFAEILYGFPRVAGAVGDMREALGMIYQPVQHVDAPDAHALQVTRGTIDMQHIDFAYPNGTKVFSDLSLRIDGGQKVGLVGFSGSGKSTLVHLLLRHYDIQSGTVTIDDQDISHVTLDSLRQAVAYVPQDSILFHRSLMENIAYGRHEAPLHDVMSAAEKASAHDFIEALQSGYDTKVGERGVKLSGGQRQRIAIARAILSNAPILVLDEATSALDSVTEKLIQDVLNQAMQGRTTIVIAHRLATLKNLDRLLVLDQGRIVEDGTLDELLAKNGHFSKLWALQSGGFLPDHY